MANLLPNTSFSLVLGQSVPFSFFAFQRDWSQSDLFFICLCLQAVEPAAAHCTRPNAWAPFEGDSLENCLPSFCALLLNWRQGNCVWHRFLINHHAQNNKQPTYFCPQIRLSLCGYSQRKIVPGYFGPSRMSYCVPLWPISVVPWHSIIGKGPPL